MQADLIALRGGEQRERGGEGAGEIELRQAGVGSVGVAHGGGGVEDQADADGRFDLALAHEVPVGTRVEFPVDVAWLIAGLVGAVLGKFARHARLPAGVQAGQEAGDESARGERQPAGGGEELRVERGGHGGRSRDRAALQRRGVENTEGRGGEEIKGRRWEDGSRAAFFVR